MKKSMLFFAIILFSFNFIWTNPWAIVLVRNGGYFHIIDLGQDPPAVSNLHGIFPPLPLIAVAISPSKIYALIAHDAGLYRLDISDPANPFSIGNFSVDEWFNRPFSDIGDIAISPDNQFAIAVSAGNNRILFIDLTDLEFKRYTFYHLATPEATAYSAAIGKDGRTVIISDFEKNRIIFGLVNGSRTGLLSEKTLPTGNKPINIAISPDGSTALVANFWESFVSVYRITAPGIVAIGSTKTANVSRGPQSIIFSSDNAKAYVYSIAGRSYSTDKLSLLDVKGPGHVLEGKVGAADLLTKSTFGRYGTDVLAVTPDMKYAVSSSCESWEEKPTRIVNLIDLNNFKVSPISLKIPWATLGGLAVFESNAIQVFPPANPTLQKLENNCIFFKEYINRLSWKTNPLNCGYPVKVRIFRKAATESDEKYILVTEMDPTQFGYDDRGLKKEQYFFYRLKSVLNNGIESDPVEIGN